MQEVKVTVIGDSLGVVLSKEVLAKLKVGNGDRLLVLETPSGVELTTYDAEVAGQLAVAEKFMHQHRDVLRKLAE